MSNRVIVYSGTARAFRTTLIGYVFEISQRHPVTLLCEELDPTTTKLLSDRSIFPKLEEIVPVHQFTGAADNPVRQARYLCRTALEIVRNKHPAVVVATSDNDSLFELFLMRFARRQGAFTVSISCTLTHPDVKAIRQYVDLLNVHERMAPWLPIWARVLLVKTRKYAGHGFRYWLQPLVCGQTPFWGLTSYILHRGHNGMRDAAVQVVMHEKDATTYRKRGVPVAKLVVLPHPILRQASACFRSLEAEPADGGVQKKILVLLPENNISFRNHDRALLPASAVHSVRCEILAIIATALPDWKVLVKPHPSVTSTVMIEEYCRKRCPQVTFLSKHESVEKLFSQVSAVLELPRSGSTALYSALLWNPLIPKIAINCQDEFYADYYRDFGGIEYITSIESLSKVLHEIHNGRFAPTVAEPVRVENHEDICTRVIDRAIKASADA